MKPEVPDFSKGLCFGGDPRHIENSPANVMAAVGHFDNSARYAFLFLVTSSYSSYFPTCGFIHPRYYSTIPHRTVFHAPPCRRGSHHSVFVTDPRVSCALAIYPQVMPSSLRYMLAWIPRSFHAFRQLLGLHRASAATFIKATSVHVSSFEDSVMLAIRPSERS